MLQARFYVGRGPAQFIEEEDLTLIMKACIILHHMIVKDELDFYGLAFDNKDVEGSSFQSM